MSIDIIKYTTCAINIWINFSILKSINNFAGPYVTTNIGVHFIIGLINSGNISIGNSVPTTNISLSYIQWNGVESSIQKDIMLIAILKIEFINIPKYYC